MAKIICKPANSQRRRAPASRPHPSPVVRHAPGSKPRVRNASRPRAAIGSREPKGTEEGQTRLRPRRCRGTHRHPDRAYLRAEGTDQTPSRGGRGPAARGADAESVEERRGRLLAAANNSMSPSCCPSSLHTTHGPPRPKGRGGSSYSHRTRASARASQRRQAAASRPHPKPVVQDAPGSSPRARNAARSCPSRNRTSPLRATAPSPSRVAPARGIPMADSTRAHRGPPAVVGQLADDGGGRRSTPGPCAHVARGLRFEGAAARAEPRSFSRSTCGPQRGGKSRRGAAALARSPFWRRPRRPSSP
jgi:hypothetical protein